jgi:hypothetical protein
MQTLHAMQATHAAASGNLMNQMAESSRQALDQMKNVVSEVMRMQHGMHAQPCNVMYMYCTSIRFKLQCSTILQCSVARVDLPRWLQTQRLQVQMLHACEGYGLSHGGVGRGVTIGY